MKEKKVPQDSSPQGTLKTRLTTKKSISRYLYLLLYYDEKKIFLLITPVNI